MEVIQDDIKLMEDDANKINCNAILDFFRHTIKCINDCISYFCKGSPSTCDGDVKD